MKHTAIFSSVAIAMAAYTVFASYAVVSQKIEPLLICADQGGLRIPFSKNICRAYLFNFRGTEEDIANLEQGIGASFVIQGESSFSEREQVLEFLLSKNLNLNNIGMHRLAPLHEAVLANSVNEVTLLLRHGANTHLQDAKFGLTPLQFARKLQADAPQVDRGAVIDLLENNQ